MQPTPETRREPERPHRPVVLTIAGSDSSGGAGIQADLKVFAVLRCAGASAITAVTAQNTCGVRRVVGIAPDMVVDQIDVVAEDLPVAAAKTGMLGTVATIEAVADALRRHRLPHVVIDPVMVAKSGDPLIDAEAVAAVARHLLPLADVTTPNRHEAARLLGLNHPITTPDQARDAATAICERFGSASCIVKGVRVGDRMQDHAHLAGESRIYEAPHHPAGGTHGSGCAFSAALAAHLALGHPLPDALPAVHTFINHAIAHATPLGQGITPIDPLALL